MKLWLLIYFSFLYKSYFVFKGLPYFQHGMYIIRKQTFAVRHEQEFDFSEYYDTKAENWSWLWLNRMDRHTFGYKIVLYGCCILSYFCMGAALLLLLGFITLYHLNL